MKNNISKFYLLFLASFGFILTLSSCSVIGYGIGTAIEPSSSHDTVPIFRNIDDYKGQEAKIQLADSVCFATFDDYHGEDPREYASRYADFSSTKPKSEIMIEPGKYIKAEKNISPLLILSPIALFIEVVNSRHSGSFSGYAPDGIILDGNVLKLSKFDEFRTTQKISKDLLLSSYESNSVPIEGWIHFHTKTEEFDLKNSDFTNTYILPHRSYARWVGMVIGLVVDAFVIDYVINHPPNLFSNWNWSGGGGNWKMGPMM